jgi:hypothetical protein
MNNFNYKRLPPFKWFILENFPFIEADFDALTNWQLFCKLGKEMNKIINSVNTSGSQVETLTNAFNNLQDYVNNYFNNLDVQNEINNKLDEMAQDGTLQNIIEEYLNLGVIFHYDNINNMKSATNLKNGNYAQTGGFYQINDNGSAKYYIRNKNTDEVENGITTFEITNTNLIAELIKTDTINVAQLGAKPEENFNNSSIINFACENFKKIIFNSGTYLFNNMINLKSNNHIIGNYNDTILYMPNSADSYLFRADNIENLIIEELTIKNTSSNTSTAVPNYRLGYFTNCKNITFNHCYLTDLYSQGLVFKSSKNLTFTNVHFYRAGNSMIALLTEVENVLIDNCIFDTATANSSNPYLFMTGSDDYTTQVEFMCRNVTIQNSKFLNNPRWEGIESHGCSNFIVLNNYIENCYDAIHCYWDDRTENVIDKTRENIIVKNNVIKNTSVVPKQAMILGGSQNSYVDGIIVENNCVEGTGQGLYVIYGNNVSVCNNVIKGIDDNGIRISYCCHGNCDNNLVESFKNDNTIGIYIAYSWLISCKFNKLSGKFFRAITSGNCFGLILLGVNYIDFYSQFRYYFGAPNSTLINLSNTEAHYRGCKGIYSMGDDGLPLIKCTDDIIKSEAGTITGKITANVGDTIINVSNLIAEVCVGEQIIIKGAGTSGGDLTTQILKYTGNNTAIIKDPIVTSVVNADIQTVNSTWVTV